jgi:hypothetical protein
MKKVFHHGLEVGVIHGSLVIKEANYPLIFSLFFGIKGKVYPFAYTEHEMYGGVDPLNGRSVD